jgi:hypothetical protein
VESCFALSRIEVEPGQLHTASGRQGALADQVTGLAGRVDSAGHAAAGAAGEMVAGAAIADFTMAWSLSLQMLAQSLGGLAANVGAAGSAYTATDHGAMPGVPR